MACPAKATKAGEVAEIIDALNAPTLLPFYSFHEETTETAETADGTAPSILRVVFPKIRECDACLVSLSGESILIDCATSGMADAVVSMLKDQKITHLSGIYLTHPHPDHVGGLSRILAEFSVDAVWTCFSDTTNEQSKALPGICQEWGVPLKTYGEGDTFRVGEALFEVYAATDRALSINDRSAAMRMTYGKAVMFFAADLEARGLRRLGNMLSKEELHMDIIKYPHHGKNGLVHEFWEKADLRYAIVTSDSSPREGKQDIIYKGWSYAYTWDGEILLRTDGSRWIISRADAVEAPEEDEEADGRREEQEAAEEERMVILIRLSDT